MSYNAHAKVKSKAYTLKLSLKKKKGKWSNKVQSMTLNKMVNKTFS